MRKQHLSRLSIRPRPAQAGVSMIEFLVALIIFAFGTLGLAGLQTQALAYSQGSLYRSQATTLTDDILDRMRADRGNAKLGTWDTALTNPSTYYSGSSIAQKDLKDWKEQVEAALPSGQASISVGSDTFVTITIQWDDSRGARQTGTNQVFETMTRL